MLSSEVFLRFLQKCDASPTRGRPHDIGHHLRASHMSTVPFSKVVPSRDLDAGGPAAICIDPGAVEHAARPLRSAHAARRLVLSQVAWAPRGRVPQVYRSVDHRWEAALRAAASRGARAGSRRSYARSSGMRQLGITSAPSFMVGGDLIGSSLRLRQEMLAGLGAH